MPNIRSWDVDWPEGFPLPWMELLYKELPTGEAERASQPEHGGGTMVPVDLAKGDKLKEDLTDAVERLQETEKLLESEQGKKPVDAKRVEELTTAVKQRQEEVDGLRSDLVKAWTRRPAGEKYYTTPEGETLPTEQAGTFLKSPERRDPFRYANGKRGLSLAVKDLSNRFRKTQQLVNDLRSVEERVHDYQKEIDLILSYRHRQFVRTPEGGYRHSFTKSTTYPPQSALDELQKLKEAEFRRRDFLLPLEKKDTVMHRFQRPEFNKHFGLGEEEAGRTFFDLTPEELDMITKEYTESGEKLSKADIEKLSKKYAESYRNFILETTKPKDPVKVVEQVLSNDYDIVVNDKQAEQLYKQLTEKKPQVDILGVDKNTSEEVKTSLEGNDAEEFHNKVIAGVWKNFTDRVFWLKNRQDQRKAYLATKRKELGRLLVERSAYLESGLDTINDQLNVLVPALNNVMHQWEGSQSPEERSNLLKKVGPVLFKNVMTLKDSLKEIASDEQYKEFLDLPGLSTANSILDKVITSLKEGKVEDAIRDVDVFQNSFRTMYTTPVLSERKYKEAMLSIFFSFIPQAQTTLFKQEAHVPSRYETLEGPAAFTSKYKEMDDLFKQEESIQEEITKIKSHKNDLYKPVLDYEEKIRQYQKSISHSEKEVASVYEETERLNEQITSLENQLTVHNAHEAAELEKLIHDLKRQKAELWRDNKFSDAVQSRIREMMGTMNQLESMYQNHTKPLNKKLKELEDKLDKISDKRYELQSELGNVYLS